MGNIVQIRMDYKFVKGEFSSPLCLSLGGVCVNALGLTLSPPCETFWFHPKNPFLIHSPLFPFPRFGRWWCRGCFFLGRVFAFLSVGVVIKIVVLVGFGAGIGE